MASEQPTFNFGTDPAPVEAKEGIKRGVLDESSVEGEPTSRRSNPAMAASAGSEVERHAEWREVPQALFDSWLERQQLAYCAARDRDSALNADTDEWTLFYFNRARMYDAEISAASV